MSFARYPKKLQLRDLGSESYALIYEYLKASWSDKFSLVADVELSRPGIEAVSFTGAVNSFPFFAVGDCRYDSFTASRSKTGWFAYINGRQPVHIEYIFGITQKAPDGSEHYTTALVVRRFLSTSNLDLAFPWDLS